MSKNRKNVDFDWIYSTYCVDCTVEGTYKCKLEVRKGKCKNFTTDEENVFGGY